ncbi:MAG: serine/threonine protein kinase, partial [Planctomycetaceae bacterium]|nr:serine/threonine protein kinase [Planctomycetaceae bacterium]
EMPLVDLSERYEIQDVLGKGGMGEVLRALDTRLKRPVAIKRVLGEMARSKKALSRFLTEAQSIAALNHFNIVQIYDYGRDAEGPFIIMELVEGESLQERLREGALELEEAVKLTCQLCDGLAVAHDQGIVHRDIKPANILLTKRGEPKLTDFGLARQETVDHGQTQAGAVLGTIDFMPPEQRRDATATDGRSDLWSLAATLYQMVTGKSPKIIKFNNVPQALQDVLGKALEDAPGERYQTATDLSEA